MSRHARIRTADTMIAEISEYLARTLPPGTGTREEVWEAITFADRAAMAAIRAWERGEISYAELEEAGVRYVEAWEEAAS